MSYEQNGVPIMSNSIMFHNEARVKPDHPYSRPPDRAFQGLDENKIARGLNLKKTYNPPSGKLYMQPKGYCHTGANVGVCYQIPQLDPNWTRPVYGNSKPLALKYSTSSSNLLSRY